MTDLIFDGLQSDITLNGAIDTFIDKTALKIEKCGLKHAPKSYNIPLPDAADYLCQNIGYVSSGDITELIRVPICQECIDGLHDTDWALIYCVNCHNSQWIYKPKSSYIFHTNVVWLDECPHCNVKKEEE